MKYTVVNRTIICPGLHSWPTAEVLCKDVTRIEAAETIRRHNNLNKALGDNPGECTVFDDADKAQLFVNAVNWTKERNLAEWRKSVYSEAIPAAYDVVGNPWARLTQAAASDVLARPSGLIERTGLVG